jgi:hypothetical protein
MIMVNHVWFVCECRRRIMARNRRRQSDNVQKEDNPNWLPEDAPEDAESDEYEETVAKKRKLYRRLPTPGITEIRCSISRMIRLF